MGKAQDAKIAETMLTAENGLLGAKRHMGRMGNVVLIEQIWMDCTGCRTALGCQWHNSPRGRSLHRDEFHRHGDMNMTSPGKDILLQRIAGLNRDALMMSLFCF